jgi:hypothetical protein
MPTLPAPLPRAPLLPPVSIVSADNFFVDSVASVGDWLFTVVTVTLFVIAELIPFLASLGTDVLGTFGPLRRQHTAPAQLAAESDGAGGDGGLGFMTRAESMDEAASPILRGDSDQFMRRGAAGGADGRRSFSLAA